ncbi:MAG: hypothetical protein ACLQJR_32440 [Stellaceae bacterium]
MGIKSDRLRLPPGNDHIAGPTLAGLGWKLGFALALASTLALGSDRAAATLCLLLEGLCAALGAISIMLALLRRERLRPSRYGSWHEAAALGAAALASHLALLALS